MLDLFGLIFTVAVLGIPGLVLSFALFTGTRFTKIDKVFAGGLLGLILAPFLSFVEYLAFGMQISAVQVLVNSLIVLIAGVALLYKRNLLSLKVAEKSISNLEAAINQNASKDKLAFLVPVLFVVFVAIAFLARVVYTHFTGFFEFDPYYYNFLTQMLVQHGSIPMFSDVSYAPLLKFHHEPPLVAYVTGSWYLLYQMVTGGVFSRDALWLVSNYYPPIAGAFLSVFAFWFLRDHYDNWTALTGAALFASTPMLIQKLSAGVSETQPWGIFCSMFIFATFALAVKHKRVEFAFLSALSAVAALLGSAQFVWPFGIVAVYLIIQAFINYYRGEDEVSLLVPGVAFAIGALFANVLNNLYTAQSITAGSHVVFFAVIGVLPSLFFWLVSQNKQLASVSKKTMLVGIMALSLALLVAPVLSGGSSVASELSSFAQGITGTAYTGSPLSKTIAEETPTGTGIFAAYFGLLLPNLVLPLFAIFIAWSAVEALFLKKKYYHLAVFLVFVISLLFFRAQIADYFTLLGASTGFSLFAVLGSLVGLNEVFGYLAIVIIAEIAAGFYAPAETHGSTRLLTGLVIYPVAFIGLSKVKFLLHLGFALVVGFSSIIGEITKRAFIFSKLTNFDLAKLTKWFAVFSIAIALFVVAGQTFGVPGKAPSVIESSMAQMNNKISPDWLDAMSWLSNNTSYENPSASAACKEKFGFDCRVMSWWDYGHWTVFFGNTKTVLDPGNVHPNFNQEVAYGFVDKQSAFMQSMSYHNATHVLVDFQLIDKWGALVFLSGTCKRVAESGAVSFTCPEERAITNWQVGAGQSSYEFEHYFERMTIGGKCPVSESLIFVQSSFGLAYCLSASEIIPLDRDGLRTDLARPYSVLSLTNSFNGTVDSNVHYLLPIGQQNQNGVPYTIAYNANPDLRVVGKNSTVLNSTYTRLYFFEQLPGFKLAYRSPRGEVKLFEQVK